MIHVATTYPRIRAPILASLIRRMPGVQQGECLGVARRILVQHPAARSVAVLAGELPVGVMCRELVADVAELPCYRQWIDREPCLRFVSHPPLRLCIDAGAAELARALTPEVRRLPSDPLVVAANGAYLGTVDVQALVRIVAETLRAVQARWRSGHALASHYPDDITSIESSNPTHGLDYLFSRSGDH